MFTYLNVYQLHIVVHRTIALSISQYFFVSQHKAQPAYIDIASSINFHTSHNNK